MTTDEQLFDVKQNDITVVSKTFPNIFSEIKIYAAKFNTIMFQKHIKND